MNSKTIRPLLAAIIIQLNIGSLYAWNMISSGLMKTHDFEAYEGGIIFGVTLLTFTGSMIPAGRLLHKFSEKRVTLVAALCYCLGFFLSGIASGNFWLILLGNGLLVGIGTGIGYVSSMTYGVAPFKRKAIPTGIITMSFALSSIIASNAVSWMNKQHFSIDLILQLFSVVQLSCMVIAIALYPSTTYGKPQDKTYSEKSNNAEVLPGFIKILPLAIGMFSATFGGLLVISNMKQIVGALEETGTIAIPVTISLFSIGNALGRILFGLLPLKRYALTIATIMLCFSATLFIMGNTSIMLYLYILILLIGLQFGSFFVLFPLATISAFGSRSISHIYPIIFIFYGIAAAVSAPLAGALYKIYKSPLLSLNSASVIEFAGAGVILFSLHQSRKIKTS